MECEIRFSTRWENEEFGGEFFVCSVRVLSDASNEKIPFKLVPIHFNDVCALFFFSFIWNFKWILYSRMHVCYLTVDGTHRHMNFECIAVNRNYLSLDTNKPNRILFSERKINDNKSLMIFPPFFAVCSFRSRRRMHQVVCQVFENLFLLISSFSEFDDFTRLVFVSIFFSHIFFSI